MSYQEYKKKIVDFYKSNKRVPGYNEIMSLVGFKSKNAVYKLLNKLVEEGIFIKDSKGKLVPQRLFGEVPLLGVVEAGLPTVAEEEILNTTSIDEFLMGDTKEDTYMLQVKGDSMIEAHIKEGDMVLVERTNSPKIGDIVIAQVDNGWTMKYLRQNKQGKFYLEPANKKYSPIFPEYDMNIGAVVKAVIRKL